MAIAANIVFVNVGSGVETGFRCRYDGTEDIEGGHGWLQEHGDDCSEQAMFVRADDGLYHSHAGRGHMRPRDIPFDAVFVTKDRDGPDKKKHVVVGMYRDADWQPDREFCRIMSRRAVIIPPSKRGTLRLQWPGRVRMWPRRDGWDRYPEMLRLYQKLVKSR